jgi:hypothetical protein
MCVHSSDRKVHRRVKGASSVLKIMFSELSMAKSYSKESYSLDHDEDKYFSKFFKISPREQVAVARHIRLLLNPIL